MFNECLDKRSLFMIKYIYQKLHKHYHQPNYLYFLLSLVLLILLPPFAELLEVGELLVQITFGVVVFMSVLYTTTSTKETVLYFILGALLYTLFLYAQSIREFGLLNVVLMFVFFSLVFIKIVRYILKSKAITVNDVYACVSGYLVLGIMAAPNLFLIEQLYPGSFSGADHANFYDFLYFSYITLTTVGFGDITPVHPLAKSLSLLISITGQLYLTILVAIIIGKYLTFDQVKNS